MALGRELACGSELATASWVDLSILWMLDGSESSLTLSVSLTEDLQEVKTQRALEPATTTTNR